MLKHENNVMYQQAKAFGAGSGNNVRARKHPLKVDNTRVGQLTPILLREIEDSFADSEYFTRDHILYFTCLRQFSMSYRISLIREIMKNLLTAGRVIRYNITDFGINNAANVRRRQDMQTNKEVAYSGSYTTRAADELLKKAVPVKRFDSKWLSEWLLCLDHLAPTTRLYYARRIIDDLVRRGVLKRHTDSHYTVNYI
jgi:hypothetical protein